MRILYCPSGHPLQEACDCLMWHQLGLKWFSTGYYATTNKPGDLPEIPHKVSKKLLHSYRKCGFETFEMDKEHRGCGKKNLQYTGQIASNLLKLTPEFVKNFDVIFFNYFIHNVENNWNLIKNKIVIFKTYSMHPIQWESLIKEYRNKNLLVVRNSPKEHLRVKDPQDYAGHDAIIRGSVVKDEHEISGWIGDKKQILTLANNFNDPSHIAQRRRRIYSEVLSRVDYPFKLYGACANEDPLSYGFISHQEKIKELQHSRVSLCPGTPGSNNTYSFVEAWIMGLPQVIFGPKLWDSPSYEAGELIEHGVDGFYSDDIKELAHCIKLLMKNDHFAQQMSIAARNNAIKVYGRDVLREQWREFFEEHYGKI